MKKDADQEKRRHQCSFFDSIFKVLFEAPSLTCDRSVIATGTVVVIVVSGIVTTVAIGTVAATDLLAVSANVFGRHAALDAIELNGDVALQTLHLLLVIARVAVGMAIAHFRRR